MRSPGRPLRPSSPRRSRAALALLALCAALASCSGQGSGAGGSAGSGRPAVIPAGAEELLRAVRAEGARAVLVNVWATWCMPCREEFPHLLRLRREYGPRGLRVILVSGDFDSEMPAVVRFLEEQGVDFPTYIKSGKDMEFIDALEPRWSGALPATFIYDARGSLRHFWEHKASYATFEQRVLEVLNQPADGAGGEDAT